MSIKWKTVAGVYVVTIIASPLSEGKKAGAFLSGPDETQVVAHAETLKHFTTVGPST